MKIRTRFFKTIVVTILVLIFAAMPVCASGADNTYTISPRYGNANGVALGIAADLNNVIYILLDVDIYEHGSGVSGLIKLFDSSGTCLTAWSVSDYEKPIYTELTYQGESKETYTATFAGYIYSNNGTPPDRLELSDSVTCK